MAKQKILYCGCFNNENLYRYFIDDTQAVKELKKLAIKRHANLTDITKKQEGKWTRIRWA